MTIDKFRTFQQTVVSICIIWSCHTTNDQKKEATTRKKDTPKLNNVIEIDEARIWDNPGDLVCGSIEETLNALLEVVTAQLCNTGRYERVNPSWRLYNAIHSLSVCVTSSWQVMAKYGFVDIVSSLLVGFITG